MRPLASLALFLALFLALAPSACDASSGPRHRERAPLRDGECKDASRPRAFFYPAENRTDYGPDDPHRDGCALLVADHLFCCPDAKRSTDR